MLIDYFRLGLKNLKQRRLRSWLTMIGIFIGIAAVVGLISLGEGMQMAITAQFASLGSDTITVQSRGGGFGPPGSYQTNPLTTDDLKVLKRVRGVDNAFGRLIETVTVEIDKQTDFGYVATLSDDNEGYDLSITIPTELNVQSGRLVSPGDGCKIMIGNNLHTRDQMVRKLNLGEKILMEGKSADIVGILEKTGNPQLDNTIFATETCVRDILDIDEKYGLLVAKAQPGQNIDDVQKNIEKALRKSRDVELGREDFNVASSQETVDSLNNILGAVQWVLIGIASISLLVGGVGITNTMYTAVLERTKEIGIMKAIGARNEEVLTLFLIESGLLGLSGGAIGVLIGVGLSLSVASIAKIALGTSLIEAHFPWWLIVGALLFSFLTGSISGITPARQASRMKPVEALSSG